MFTFQRRGLTVAVAVFGVLVALDRAALVPFSPNDRLAEMYGQMSVFEITMLASAASMGAALLSVWTGKICLVLGAPNGVRLAAPLYTAACLATFFSPSNLFVVVAKTCKGVALGVVSVAAPIYIAEVFTGAGRPMAVAAHLWFAAFAEAITVGCAFVFLSRRDGPRAFHYTWIAECGWGLVALAALVFTPHSPAHLARKGKLTRASLYLNRLNRGLGKGLELFAARPLHLATDQPQEEPPAQPSELDDQPTPFASLFSPALARPVLLATALAVLLRVVCPGPSAQFTHFTLAFCNLDSPTTLRFNGVLYELRCVCAALPLAILGGCQRKDVLGFGYFLLASTFGAMAVVARVYLVPAAETPYPFAPNASVSLVAASSVLALLAFTISVGLAFVAATLLLYVVEVLPRRARVHGVAVAVSASWAADALFQAASLQLSLVHPYVLFSIMSGVSLLGVLVVLLAPETRDRAQADQIPYPRHAMLANEKALDAIGPVPPSSDSRKSSWAGNTLQSELQAKNVPGQPPQDNPFEQDATVAKQGSPVLEPVEASFQFESTQFEPIHVSLETSNYSIDPPMVTAKTRFPDSSRSLRSLPSSNISGMWSESSAPVQ